jgi:hypothetical protein
LLNLGVLRLHITNHHGHHFTIGKIVHMRSHSCPFNNKLHMIKYDPSVLQIPCKLHSCDEARSTPHTIYWHLEINTFNLS